MIPYFIVLLLIILFAALDRSSKNDFFKISIFVVLIFFSGFRYYVGVDYEGYVNTYNSVSGFKIKEPGGALILNTIKQIGGTEQLYFLVMAIFTQVFIYKVLIKNKRWFWTSVFVYYTISLFYFASFNTVRQHAAISVALWALHYIEKHNLLKYVVTILLAAFFFHLTVLIFIPLYFYLRKEHSLLTYIGLILVAVFISGYISLFASITFYQFYTIIERDDKVNAAQYLFMFFSLLMLFIGQKFAKFKNDPVLFNMNSLCLYTLIIVGLQPGLFAMLCQRINNYFIMAYLLIIPSILASMNKKNRALCKRGIFIFCFLYFIRTIVFTGEHYKIVPYDVNFQLFNF